MIAAHVQEFSFSIASTHPSLAGHFPGNPLVPGVLVLDEVVSGVARTLGADLQVRGIPQVKFVASLRPEQTARVRIEHTSASQLRFAVHHENALIAQGVLTLAGPDTNQP